MGFFSRFVRRKNPNPKAVSKPVDVRDFSSSSTSYNSIDSTTFSVIDRIASEFAMLSYGIYDKNHHKVDNHPFEAVWKRPSLEELHFIFCYESIWNYFNGGIYWLKVKGTRGQLVSLFRLAPAEVKRTRNPVTGRYEYRYNGKIYSDDEIVYIPSRYAYSTLTGGKSIFSACPAAFDIAKKLDNYTSSAFGNGIGGKRLVVDISQALPDATETQISEIKTDVTDSYCGPENAGKPLIKKKGIEYSEIGQTSDNRASELTDSRKFQEKEVAKIFGYSSELLSGATASVDIEKAFTMILEFAVKPLAYQIQEYINLLLDDDCYFEFNFNGMMKVSLASRIDAYNKQIGMGLLSPDEARAKEDLPPIPDGAGKNFFMPVNLMPLNKETIDAYMAKQKNEIAGLNKPTINPTDENSQHFAGGDDKQ